MSKTDYLALPSAEALRTAAEWLDVNEGEGYESIDCHAVAFWLRKRASEIEMAEAIETVMRIVPGATRMQARRAIGRAMK